MLTSQTLSSWTKANSQSPLPVLPVLIFPAAVIPERTLPASSTLTMDAEVDGMDARNLSAGLTTTDGQNVTSTSGFLAAPAAQDSNIAKLPRELLDQVTSYLPTLDFNNLRLTCKLVENKIFPYWSNTFFKKRQFSTLTPSQLTLFLYHYN